MTLPTYDLAALRRCADAACDLAFNEKIEGPINWGDLGCVYAHRFTRDYDDGTHEEGYLVHIEELDANNPELCAFITARLLEGGFENVEVEMEW